MSSLQWCDRVAVAKLTCLINRGHVGWDASLEIDPDVMFFVGGREINFDYSTINMFTTLFNHICLIH